MRSFCGLILAVPLLLATSTSGWSQSRSVGEEVYKIAKQRGALVSDYDKLLRETLNHLISVGFDVEDQKKVIVNATATANTITVLVVDAEKLREANHADPTVRQLLKAMPGNVFAVSPGHIVIDADWVARILLNVANEFQSIWEPSRASFRISWVTRSRQE
jgi:hypothetical protein